MKKLILLATLAIVAIAAGAKNHRSYNLERGIDAANNKEYDEALDYLNRALHENYKCGEAWLYCTYVRLCQDKPEKALFNAEKAISFLPKRDKDNRAWAFDLLHYARIETGDTIGAISALKEAIHISPDRDSFYRSLGRIYSDLDDTENARKMYQKAHRLNPHNIAYICNIAYSFWLDEEPDSVLEYTALALKEDGTDDYALGCRAAAEAIMNKEDEATDDLVKAMESKPWTTWLKIVPQNLSREGIEKLLVKISRKEQQEAYHFDWSVAKGKILQGENRVVEAIEAYTEALRQDDYDWLREYIAQCYRLLGNEEQALLHIEKALEMDSTWNQYMHIKQSCLINLQRWDDAIEWSERCELLDPQDAYWEQEKGFILAERGEWKEAVKEFKEAAILFHQNSDIHYWYGIALLHTGDSTKSREEFEKALTIKEQEGDYTGCVLAYLGRRDEALKTPSAEDEDYNTACMYAILGDSTQAVESLKKMFANPDEGYLNFGWMQTDPDMENIRQTTAYLNMRDSIGQIIDSLREETNRIEGISSDSTQAENLNVEVPFTKSGNMLVVKCKINELPLNFYLDTGASDVSISSVEANFMMKNGYLSSSDILGKTNYTVADGSIREGTVINLRQINFGGLELTNVRASVVNSQKAPLLLGQSVLQRLGSVEIDNVGKRLRITTK